MGARNVVWTEQCQDEIDKLIAQHGPKDVLVVAITRLVEAKIASSFYNVGIGGLPSSDPAQEVDFYERLLSQSVELLEVKNAV